MESDRIDVFIVRGINEVRLKSHTWVIRPDFVSVKWKFLSELWSGVNCWVF